MTDSKNLTKVREFRCILLVHDLEAQKKFYQGIFHWPVINDWGGGILYDTGVAVLELIQDSSASKPNGSSRIAISVPDVWQLFEKIKNKVTIEFPLRNNSWGDTSFRIKDPEGFPITIFTSKLISQSVASAQVKTNLVLPILFAALISTVIFGVGGYYFGYKTPKTQETSLEVSSLTPIATNENNKLAGTKFPFPVVRIKTKTNYADWTFYKDQSGYIFYYPKNWFVSEGGSQVQSWDPNNSTSRPRPLDSDETKWDLYFGEKSFSSFEEAMSEADSSIDEWDMLEVSSTTKGWPVYFAYKEATEPIGSAYVVAVILTPENSTITLHGFSSDTKNPNFEILKQIVESIQK